MSEESKTLETAADASASGTPRYPDIEVQLSGEDGNAFSIIARVRRALTDAGHPRETVEAFTETATDGDYDHVLQTCMNWVTVR